MGGFDLSFFMVIFQPVINFFLFLSYFFIAFVLLFLVYFCLRCKFNFSVGNLESISFKSKYLDLLRWIVYDLHFIKCERLKFKEYGFTFYVGRQGAGKTISMVDYLLRMKRLYPKCLIVTNFSCSVSDRLMTEWRDLLNIRNGEDGVIFAIDEIQSEYSSAKWKDFPESLLSEISQQRKQKVKIVATCQSFMRVAKPLREQAFTVNVCSTFLSRLTRCKVYDAQDYMSIADNQLSIKKNLKPIQRFSFVQSNSLRCAYDTYQKIERMKKLDFIQRSER